MSETVRYQGLLVLIAERPLGTFWDDILRPIISISNNVNLIEFDEGNSGYDSIESMFKDLFYQEYVITRRKLYCIQSLRKVEPEYEFCEISDDTGIKDTLSFHTMFHNGGTCLDEMLENKLKDTE